MRSENTRLIGRYKVLDELGGGGMGDVYRIWDDITKRELALKQLKFSYPRALHYFKREFRAVASLSHQNLVSLYDLHSDDEQYYYTMELIDGSDIYEYVNGHNRVITDADFLTSAGRIERIRSCMIQLFRGLAFLHRHNRIHRDIKPSNLLVSKGGQLKLVDFGIVKELLPGGQGQSLSQVFGTSTYFSPEQSLGSNVTQASDNYSAGVVLYEMLAGVPPFVGESADVALKHRTDMPPSLAQKVPGAPPDLVLLCMKLLLKEPDQRPTALEALEELDPEHERSPIAFGEFIGRAEPRKVLHESLSQVRSGVGQAVVILGEGGLGKTALLEEFARECGVFGADFFSGTCTMRDHVPLRGLDTVIERIAEAYRKETARSLRRLTEQERGLLLEHFHFLKELLPTDEHGEIDHDGSVGVALSKLLDQFASRRTLVIVIEQLELADDALLETMEALFSGSFMPPLLFVFTLNPRFAPQQTRVSSFLEMVSRSAQSKEVTLKPFGLEETIQFIEEHTYPAPRFLAEYILRESKGIPAYVGLLTQQLNEFRGDQLPSLIETLGKTFESFAPDVREVLATMAVADEDLSMNVLKNACGLSGESAFAAVQELRFLRYAEFLTDQDGANRVVANEAHALDFIRQILPIEKKKERHKALAKAFERNCGNIEAIIRHWTAADMPEKAIKYASEAVDQAHFDLHRAADLLNLLLESTHDSAERARILWRLTVSLSRQGRFRDALKALSELKVLEPDKLDTIRAKYCHFALLCGDIDGFESHFVGPSTQKRGLARLLLPYLPSRVEQTLAGEQDRMRSLVHARNLLHSLDEKAVRQAEALLTRVPESKAAEEPMEKIHFVIAQTKLQVIQGDFAKAKDALALINQTDLDRLDEPHRYKPEFELAQAEVMMALGDYLSARSLARGVVRYAQPLRRIGLQSRAGILLAHLNLACEELPEVESLHQLKTSWQSNHYTLIDAHLALLEIWYAFHSHQTDAVSQQLAALKNRVHFMNATDIRSVHRVYVELEARHAIYVLLTESRTPDDFNASNLAIKLRKHPGLPTDLISVIRLADFYAKREWNEIEGHLQARGPRPLDPLAESLCLAIRGAALERTHKSGLRAWQSSLHCLKNAGLALPPEVHHFKGNFERGAVKV